MNNEVLELLKKSNAIFEGHFIFTSGKHAPRYIDKMVVFAHPIYASQMARFFAEKYKNHHIDVVVAPAMGGIILSTWTAYYLSKLTNSDVVGIYTEKTEDKQQVFTRGFDKYVKSKNVLIVEDNVTTGGSVKKVVDAVKNAGGNVVEVCAMTNINPIPQTVTDKIIGAKFSYLIELPVDLYDEDDCPLCRDDVPVDITHGHGKKYLEAKAKKT
jgi:orotate phosphoribosyltransferase